MAGFGFIGKVLADWNFSYIWKRKWLENATITISGTLSEILIKSRKLRKLFKISLIIFISIILCSCNHKGKIKNYLETNCSSSKCVNTECEVKMQDIITDDWDYMYVFYPEDSLEKINSELGFEYKCWEDIATTIIFVKNNVVIYHEDEFPYPEKKAKIVFTNPNKRLIKIPKHKAIFTSKIVDSSFYLYLKD